MEEKKYNVKELAKMLNTNPETIRRWIRDNKMVATLSTRKEGSLVTEQALQSFLKATPKYAKTNIGTGAFVAGAAITGVIASALYRYYREKKKPIDNKVPGDWEDFTKSRLQKIDEDITRRQEQIDQMKEELLALEEEAKQYKYLVDHPEEVESFVERQNEEEG